MAKSGKSKASKISNKSSGLSRRRRANKELRKVCSKLRRWTRYNAESHLGRTWNLSGLEKRMEQLKCILLEDKSDNTATHAQV